MKKIPNDISEVCVEAIALGKIPLIDAYFATNGCVGSMRLLH